MDRSRTLEQLEAHPWPDPPGDCSSMVARCHALRRVPLAQLSAGDCRVLLTQGIGTRHVIPVALDVAEAGPLIEGDYYPGDLLLALLRIPRNEWSAIDDGLDRLVQIARRAEALLASDPEPTGSDNRLRKDIQAAQAACGA